MTNRPKFIFYQVPCIFFLISRGFPRLRKLEELHMCNIPTLKYIGAGALAGLENLKRLHLSFNPSLEHIDPKALARPDEIGETYVWPLLKEVNFLIFLGIGNQVESPDLKWLLLSMEPLLKEE